MANHFRRAGTFIKQPGGYMAFIPLPLPPAPKLLMDNELISLLSNADRALGRLDGITQTLPNPELFVSMYIKKEAVLSAQIEGTQASLIDILNADELKSKEKANDLAEIANYINAMSYGLKRLTEFPVSLRLLKEIHKILLYGVRGGQKQPGEFRTSQNWVGGHSSTIATAVFIPPPVPEMKKAIADLEKYMHTSNNLPALIKIGLIHAQFETIHPFLDGNGRIGRLLIMFWLCWQEILSKPLLYLSYYFKINKMEYYDRLMAVRTNGDWESWLKFFWPALPKYRKRQRKQRKKLLK
ncbi:MAG: Fic family protein [Acidaminococcales bacterium]|jgi:Fic family protein|nr:Fic family protein [Acidaminococcales bacterium]